MAHETEPMAQLNGRRGKISNSNSDLERLWETCIGDDVKGDTTLDTTVEQEKEEDNEAVSIRCRRHKRRFNVEKRWLTTCKWLCPRCYEKLTPTERLKYAPPGDEVEVRPAEPNQKVVCIANTDFHNTTDQDTENSVQTFSNKLPKIFKDAVEITCIYCGERKQVSKEHFWEDHLFCEDCSPELSDGGKARLRMSFIETHNTLYKTIEEEYRRLLRLERAKKAVEFVRQAKESLEKHLTNESSQLGNAKPRVQHEVVVGFSPDLAALMPRWRMECLKCGKVVSVHKPYLDNTSSVLCPSCSSNMSYDDINEFHRLHTEESAKTWEVEYESPVLSPKKDTHEERMPIVPIRIEDSSDVAAGGFYSNSTIMRMSIEELQEAVKSGRVSKARARIEKNRRRNHRYFDSLSDVMPVSPMLP